MGEAPAIAEEEESDEPTVDDAADVVDEHENESSSDVQEAEVELTEDDLGEAGELFDDVETAESDESGQQSGASPDTSDGSDEDEETDMDAIADGLEGNAAAMEDAFNEGAARLGVIGLTDEDFEDSSMDKETLEEELQETFEAFRLGYFGSRAVEEYILEPADQDVSPAWGLLGSVLLAGAMTVWLRPDGDEAIEKARDKISGFTGGSD